MLLVTSIVIGVLGAAARFQAASEVAGFKMHALGVSLMVLAIVGVIGSVKAGALPRFSRTLPAPTQA